MELHPNDANLLAATTDPSVGFDHIPTGTTPYHLHFRRLMHRIGLAAARANDLRVYEAGPLSIGVNAGRCTIADQAFTIAEQTSIAVTGGTTTQVFIDENGTVQATTDAFPADRGTHLRLAQVTADSQAITQIDDLRSESVYQTPSAALLGLTATRDEINQALTGISPYVTAAFLNILTDGPNSIADSMHQHRSTSQQVDGRASISMSNFSVSASATMALEYGLPYLQPQPTFLELGPDHTHLQQNTATGVYPLVGSTHVQSIHPGSLNGSLADQLIGAIPISGTVSDVILSVSSNTQSPASADGLAARVSVNGQALTTTDPSLSAADGSGFRCTDAGDGTAAVIDPTPSVVSRGDLLTVDLTVTDTGPITQAPTDVVLLVVIRPDKPE